MTELEEGGGDRGRIRYVGFGKGWLGVGLMRGRSVERRGGE
jgi:hypothetical protein